MVANHSLQEEAIKATSGPNTPKDPDCKNSLRTTDVVRSLLAHNAAAVSCMPLPALRELTAFQAHGHCIQPCESEQVTHTS